MRVWLREQLGRRPRWMNALLFVCAYLTFVFLPWDFFLKPVARDEEVWFGLMLRGWWAKATEPLHWAIYAAGTYGFWRMRAWMWPWASLYVWQLAIASLIWSVVYVGGGHGWIAGIFSGGICAVVAVALWRARDEFGRPPRSLSERYGKVIRATGMKVD